MLQSFKQWLNQVPDVKPASVIRVTRTLDKVHQLPPLSDTTLRAMELANDPDVDLREFVILIRRDGAVTASVLKMANSVIYGGRPAATLEAAVIRLGMRGCKNLLTAIGMRSLFRSVPAKVQECCELVWQHSFFTASLASFLNDTNRLGFAGEEFTAGLLHDLGRLIIAVSVPELFHTVDPMDFAEDYAVLEHERKILGKDHCSVGADFARRNQLPPSIISAIEFHHSPNEAMEHRPLTALVAFADHLANHVQRESKITNYQLQTSPGYQVLSASWDAAKDRIFREGLSQVVVKAIKETRAVIKTQIG